MDMLIQEAPTHTILWTHIKILVCLAGHIVYPPHHRLLFQPIHHYMVMEQEQFTVVNTSVILLQEQDNEKNNINLFCITHSLNRM